MARPRIPGRRPLDEADDPADLGQRGRDLQHDRNVHAREYARAKNSGQKPAPHGYPALLQPREEP
jgi:hypothetical protein